jgi:hypothetical protein
VRSLIQAQAPTGQLDSDQPSGRRDGPWNLVIIIGFVVATVGFGAVALWWKSRMRPEM